MTAEDATTRDEILTRYRHLRTIGIEHHGRAIRFLSRQAILGLARRLGLAERGTLVAESDHELTLIFDLALYSAKSGRSGALERYRKASRLAEGSDAARMLDAMSRARFSVWRIERRHERAGLIVADLLRESEAWLVDEGLEQSAPEGTAFAMRLCQPDAFEMTSGVVLPVDGEIMTAVLASRPHAFLHDMARVADDPKFAEAIYRTVLTYGLLDQLSDEDPDEPLL